MLPDFLIVFAADGCSLPSNVLSAADTVLRGEASVEAVVVLDAAERPLRAVWTELPTHIAVLARPADSLAIVVPRRLADVVEHIRDDGDARWQWMIAAARHPGRVGIVTANEERRDQLRADGLPALVPRPPGRDRRWLLERLTAVSRDDDSPQPDTSVDADALCAGLLQLHDFLDESHQVSQRIEGRGRNRSGDYWHGILHRREPDDSNARYWFRQVGRHPVFAPLAEEAMRILAESTSPQAPAWADRLVGAGHWDAFAFVDLCSQCRRDADDALAVAARRIQLAEMLLLLVQTHRDATDHPAP